LPECIRRPTGRTTGRIGFERRGSLASRTGDRPGEPTDAAIGGNADTRSVTTTVATARGVHGTAPAQRRRVDEAWLADRLALFARRNEALDDFASLIAHELRGTLLAAASRDPEGVGRALELIDELLDAARSEGAEEGWAETREGLAEALRDLRGSPPAIESHLEAAFPLPLPLLRIVLRNLIANAVAASASTVRLTSRPSRKSWRLTVEDDGAGFGAPERARGGGNGIGLALCRRIIERRGGSLELGESSLGGARVSVSLPGSGR
jgi:signal transduction histidine kinase